MPRAPSPSKRLARKAAVLASDRRGGTAIEYGLILALMVIVMIAAFQGLAGVTLGMWNNVNTKVTTATNH